MGTIRIVVGAIGCCFGIGIGSSQALTPLKPLAGYVCMSLKATQHFNVATPGALPKPPGGPDMPPVYKEPTAGSARIGYAIPTVIVASPVQRENGFVRMLWGQKGVPGWVEEDLLVPYHSVAVPTAICVPVVTANGTIGADIK